MQTTAKRPQSEHAQAAAAIRRTLKAAFPHTTFRVRSDAFSGGDSVDVGWTDGPTTDQVERLIGQHERGHFDGMIDLYEYSNTRDDIPQAKYVMTRRETSRAAYTAIVTFLNQRYGWSLEVEPAYNAITRASNQPRGNCSGWQSDDIWRTFAPMSLVCDNGAHPTFPADAYCGEFGTSLCPHTHVEWLESQGYNAGRCLDCGAGVPA